MFFINYILFLLIIEYTKNTITKIQIGIIINFFINSPQYHYIIKNKQYKLFILHCI